jgi:hypothetical protein
MVVKTQAEGAEERHAAVFISHSRKDKDFVRHLDAALEKEGRKAWVDVESILPTEDWLAKIYSGVEGSDAFVFVISPDSVRSQDCRRELLHAVEHNKRLVPIVRREVEDEAVSEPLRSPQWIFFRESDDFERSCRALTDALDTDLEWVRAHTRLLTRAIEWDNNGRDSSFLLRGSDLKTAEDWQVGAADKEPKPTPLQTGYVLSSRRAATRRQRMTLGAVTMGLIVAVVLALLAWWQRNEAVYQSGISLGRQWACT